MLLLINFINTGQGYKYYRFFPRVPLEFSYESTSKGPDTRPIKNDRIKLPVLLVYNLLQTQD